MEYIEMFAKDVMKSKGFRDLKRIDVATILRSDRLNPEKEANVLTAALEWARAEMKRNPPKDLATDAKEPDKLKAVMGEAIFTAARFPVMDISDIALTVSQTGLLDQAQTLALFTYLGQAKAAGDKGKLPPLDSSLKMFNAKRRNPRDPLLVFDGMFRVGSSARTHKGYRMMSLPDIKDPKIRARFVAAYNTKKIGMVTLDTFTINNGFMIAGGWILVNGTHIVNKNWTGNHPVQADSRFEFGLNDGSYRFPSETEWSNATLSNAAASDGYPAFLIRDTKS